MCENTNVFSALSFGLMYWGQGGGGGGGGYIDDLVSCCHARSDWARHVGCYTVIVTWLA